MQIHSLAIHIRKSSPKHPTAKFSIYFQPALPKFGVSWVKKNGSNRVLLAQKYSKGWKTIRVKGAGLQNDESVD